MADHPNFKDHFADVSSHYAAHRPTYPPDLFSWLASKSDPVSLAWDCATGTGQAACAIGRYFPQVIATDASAEQIAAAKPCPNVTYHVAPADASGIAAHTANLITVAQALHWFDLTSFYAEVSRVAAKNCLIAVWTYGVFNAKGPDSERIQTLLDHFYYDVVGNYWPPERSHVENGYQNLNFPFTEIQTPPFEMSQDWNISHLIGYLRSWSATSRYIKTVGKDPVSELELQLSPIWGPGPRRIVWPLSIKAGRIN